jgi:uncharacterized protein (DUF934 family)
MRTDTKPLVYRNGRTIHDAYTFVDDGAPLPAGPVIVSLKRFLAERNDLLSRGYPAGVRLETSQSPELLGDLKGVALVELHIPYFKDGRAFSWARLLRTRLGYSGEVRLTGHFLLDQIAFFLRVGVDSFALPAKIAAADVNRSLPMISNVYQPAADGRITVRDLRHKATLMAAE